MLITIKDIAKKAGVSVATVSYVLNNTRYVSPERKERVLRAVEELNYVPNAVARGLRVKESKTIGLILSDITNPFYPDLAKGCEDFATAKGYSVIMVNTNEQEQRTARAISQVREGKVDGLIIASATLDDKPLLEKLVEGGYSIVLAHRHLEGLQVDSVVADNFGGTTAAIRYLRSYGHTKIAMVTGINNSPVNQERVRGYLQAMESAGLPVYDEWLVPGGEYNNSYNVTLNLMQKPIEKRPTAILASNDISAMGALDAAQDLNLNIPEDLAIIGFDDLFFAAARSVQLSTVRIPRYDIGQHAARILIDRMNQAGPADPVKIVLPTQLVVRKTCGTIPMSI